MVTQSQSLETRTQKDETSNRWEKLLPLLDPAVVEAPRAKPVWQKLDRQLVTWLIRTASQFPWFNHLALTSMVYTESGAVHAKEMTSRLHWFLRWAIPEHYPDVASLKPVEALIAFFGDPPQPRGTNVCSAYNSVQLYVQRYLQSLPTAERTKLTPFLFPMLVDTPELLQVRMRAYYQTKERRKAQAFAVVKDLHALVAMGRRRFQWLVDLDAQVQRVAELVDRQQITLPAVIQCKDLDNRHGLTFRVWNRVSWVKAHRKAYCEDVLHRRTQSKGLFLQLVGSLPDTAWFLRTAEWGAYTRRGDKEDHRKYFQECNIALFGHPGKGLITPNKGFSTILFRAREVANGTPEDSRILFCTEPLLAAAAVGLFALVCLTQSGMRIGELLQVAGDKQCMKIGLFPIFDEKTGGWSENLSKLFFWQLYPKGSTDRQPYPVTPFMQEALKVWMQVHDRFCGQFKPVPPTKGS